MVHLIVGTSSADERARVPVQLTGASRHRRPRPSARHTRAGGAPRRTLDKHWAAHGYQAGQPASGRTESVDHTAPHDAGKRRRVCGSLGRHGLEGAQRAARRRARLPALGCRRCSGRRTTAAELKAIERHPTIELTFRGKIGAYSAEIIQGSRLRCRGARCCGDGRRQAGGSAALAEGRGCDLGPQPRRQRSPRSDRGDRRDRAARDRGARCACVCHSSSSIR